MGTQNRFLSTRGPGLGATPVGELGGKDTPNRGEEVLGAVEMTGSEEVAEVQRAGGDYLRALPLDSLRG